MTLSSIRMKSCFLILVATGIVVIPFSLHAKEKLISGSLFNEYKFRTTGDVEDHDLETLLSVNIGDPVRDRFSGALQGGGIFDLNGKQDDYSLSSIYDTFPKSTVGRLYYAYMNVKRFKPIENLRVGRQYLYTLDSLYFDGVSVETLPYCGLILGGYGGTPVHLFENEIGVDPGDWVAGGYLLWSPIATVRLRLDETHLRDETSAFRITEGDKEDDLLGTSLWIDFTENLDFYTRFTTFSDQVRDVEAATSLQIPDKALSFRLRGYRLLEGYDIRVVEWDAYGIAGTYEPFTQISLSATKELGRKFGINGGVDYRFLDDEQITSAFNHGYERVYVSASSHNFLRKDLDLNTTFDYYHGEDNTLKNNSTGLSFFASQKFFKKRLAVDGGTAYYLYRYNILAGNESNNVRTYFADVEGKIVKDLKAKMKYEFEDNDLDNFQTVNTSVTWEF